MPDDLRDRADSLFDQLLDLAPAERTALLTARCGDDHALRGLVERLLAAAEETGVLAAGGALQGELAGELAAELDGGSSLVGRRLGRYRVTGELGRGGMAVVYLAERDAGDFEQRVAIKLLRGEIVSRDAVRRFHQERQILARASHPNIARLLDGGITEDHRPFLVMELVEGEPIDAYCDRHRLGVRERIGLFLTAAQAVEHAHRNLVVHRDLKPSNLMVSEDGHVKLLDFGIAKLLDEDPTEATLTELRAMTPAFASPEQVRGEPITTASDIYQLGLLLYVLLTGSWPYRDTGRGHQALFAAILADPPTRPSAALESGRPREVANVERARDAADVAADRRTTPERLRRQLAGDLDTIILACLKKEPERRYATVAQLVDDLERHLSGRPIAARGDSVGYRLGKLVARHRLATAVGASSLVAIVSLVAWDNARLARERDRARHEAAKATEVARFLRGLFEVAAPTRSLGEAVTARQLLDRGAARVRQELAGQPELRAGMMTLIGSVYGELALFEEGGELLAEAIGTLRAMPDAGDGLAAALYAAGELHERNRDLGTARAELEEALTLRRAAFGPDHPEVARTATRLGAVLVADGQLDTAQPLLEQAIASLETHPEASPADLGRALIQLAVCRRDDRDYRGSIPHYERAIALLEPAVGRDHPDTVMAVMNLAYSLRYVEEKPRAEELYKDSIARYERLYGPDHPRSAVAANNYSLLLRDLKRWDEAIDYQRRALAIWERIFGPDHIQVAWCHNNLGLIEELRGNPQAALDAYRRGLEITRAAVEPGHAELHVPLQNYGRMLRVTGRPREAIPYFQQALEIRERVYGPEHSYVGRTLKDLAEAHLEAGELEQAEALLRRSVAIGIADGEHRNHRVTEPTVLLARTLAAGGRANEARDLLLAEHPLTDDEGRELIDATMAKLTGG